MFVVIYVDLKYKMTEIGSQTKTQDGGLFGSQPESYETGETKRPWGRVTPQRSVFKQLGKQSVTSLETLSVGK